MQGLMLVMVVLVAAGKMRVALLVGVQTHLQVKMGPPLKRRLQRQQLLLQR